MSCAVFPISKGSGGSGGGTSFTASAVEQWDVLVCLLVLVPAFITLAVAGHSPPSWFAGGAAARVAGGAVVCSVFGCWSCGCGNDVLLLGWHCLFQKEVGQNKAQKAHKGSHQAWQRIRIRFEERRVAKDLWKLYSWAGEKRPCGWANQPANPCANADQAEPTRLVRVITN